MAQLIRTRISDNGGPCCPRILPLLLLVLVCSLTFLLSPGLALAQQVMGPDDDPYIPAYALPQDSGMSPAARRVLQGPSLAAGLTSGPLDTVQINAIDPSLFPQICTYVEVLDENGDPISNWDADSFCVRQDSDNITDFSVVEVHENCVTSICLVIDVSGSMITNHKIDSAKAAAHAFVNQMDVLDRVAIVTFSYCYNIVQDFTSDKALLHSKINTLYASGYTAAFDGIYKGIELTVPEIGSKAVIALSDGMENYSYNCNAPPDGIRFDSWADDSTLIVNLANGGGIPVYTLSLGSEFDPTYLQRIAAGTGGDYYHAPTGAQINSIYSAIKTRLCSRYLICYTSPDLILDGTCHDVFICHKDPVTGSCDHCGQGQYCEPNPPNITIDPLPCQPWDHDVEICATVTDSDTPLADLIVRLFYRNSDLNSYTQVTMTLHDGKFCATIPGSLLPCGGDDIQYYLTASDGTSTVPSPAGAPIDHHTFSICPNHDPVCIVPADQTIRQCQPEEVCFNISSTDEDGNLLGCHINDPKGRDVECPPSGYEYCYTPSGTETVTINVHCWDDCGGECRTSFVVNFIIDQPPVITCPPDLSFDCDNVGAFGEPTVEDENPNTVTFSVSKDSIPGGECPNAYHLKRTWTATDECGNKDECTQTITVEDKTKPVISGVGPDSEIECPAQPVFSTPTASDNCDPDPSFSFLDTEEPAQCPYISITTRTWTATDACGNTETASQTIKVIDQTPPSITCPDALTLQCGGPDNEVQIAAWLVSVTGSDLCGDVSFGNNYSATAFVGGCSPGTGSQTVTFTATDRCGLQSTCTSTVTIEDTQKPAFTFCPPELDLQCGDPANEQLITQWLNAPTANDLCSGDVTITNSFDRLNYTGGCSDNTGTQVVIFTATDLCGNLEICQSTITITDTQKPSFTFCPQNLELNCGNEENGLAITSWLSSALAADQCDGDVSVTNNYDPQSYTGGCSPSTGAQLVTFTATDDCGNTEVCQATVSITDTQKPWFTFCPPNLEIECALDDKTVDPISGWLLSATAADQCDPEVTVTNDYNPNNFTGGCSPNTGSQLVTFTATDDCGNTEICQTSIIIRDTQKPWFTFCPSPLDLECGNPDNEAAIAAWLTTAVATDLCDPEVNVTNTYSPTAFTGGCSPATGSQLVTFTATDDCGNTEVCLAPITIRDTQKPVFTFCPQDLILECGDPALNDLIATWLGSATAMDQCDGPVQVNNTYAPGSYQGGCSPNTGDQLVTFIATDFCGNEEICQAWIRIRDTQKPSFTLCPQDLNVECGVNEGDIDGWLLLAAAEDQCDGPVQVTNNFSRDGFTGGCSPSTGDQLVTFTATDHCGNEEICQASIHIRDTQKPYFTFCPPGLNLECSDLPDRSVDPITFWLQSATAADQCDPQVGVTNNFTPDGFTGGCSAYTGSQLVTFTATDDCGNTEICQATVTITDTQKPSFTFCPGDLRLECGDVSNEDQIASWLISATVSDKCDLEVGVTNSYSPSGFTGGCSDNTGSQLVTFTATDDCGNTETCQATIYISDTQKPWFTLCPDDLRLQCGDQGNAGAIGGWLNTAAAEDHCDPEVTITNDFDIANLSGGCSANTGSVLVTFTATDDCGNTETCQSTLTIYDDQKPAFTFCPQDLTLDCSYFTPGRVDGLLSDWLASATASDQCDLNVIVSNDFDLGNMTGGCSDYTGDILVTFTATDDCGNTETCQATVHVTDTQKPVFTLCPQDLTLPCDYQDPTRTPIGPIQIWLESAAASDNCDPEVAITNNFNPQNFTGGCGYGTGSQLVTFTATDDCGNTETCQATVTIEDTEAPVCHLPESQEVFQCANATICYDLFATDNCDEAPTCKITSGKGTIANGQWCYAPTVDEVVTVEVECSDACGNTCDGSFTITINVNEKPVVEGPDDTSDRVCSKDEQICVGPFTVSDQDNNLDNVYSNIGSYADGQVCFTPDTAGVYTVAVCATDECQDVVCDTVIVTVSFNNPPVCQIPDDTTIFLCAPQRVCLGFDGHDPDPGDFVTCTASNSFGESQRNDCGDAPCPRYLWCYMPTKDEVIEVTVTCTDKCGATCEGTFTVTFIMNRPPTCSAPDPLNLECGAEGNPAAITAWLASASATDDRGPFTITNSYSPTAFGEGCGNTGSQEVTFTVTDSCGAQVSCASTININDNTPPTCEAPDALTLSCDDQEKEAKIDTWLASATGTDNCGDVTVRNDYNAEAFDGCNGTGSQEVTFTVMDGCQNTSTCTAVLTIEDTEDPVCNAPGPLTLECNDPGLRDKIAAWVASATGTDNCSAEVQVDNNFSYENFQGCGNTGSQEVTFTVWDACENSSSCTATITIEDTTPPAIECSNDLDVLCVSDIPEPDAESVDAWDECGSVTVTHLGDTELIEEPPCGGVVTRTYQAMDECGNTATCQQRFYVLLGHPICLVPDDPTVSVCALQGEIRLPVSSLICEAGFGGDQRVQPHETTTNPGTTTRRKANAGVTTGTMHGKTTYDRQTGSNNMAASVTQESGRCVVYSGPGFIENGEWVGYPAQLGEGPTTVTVRCYDDRCDLYCESSFTVNIQVNPAVNQPPTCTALNPPNPSPSPCGPFPSPPPSQVFIQGADPEGGPVTCGLKPGSPGIVQDCTWEPGDWNPGPGTYPITIQCTDTCGAVSETQFTVTILPQPSPPQCVVPASDQSFFLCQPAQVTAPVSAVGGVAPVTCAVVGGKGSIVSGQWRYNATVDESFDVTVRCTDACGTFCESTFHVAIDINDPPVCNTPDQVFTGCDLIQASVPIQVIDNNLSSIKKLRGPGVITNGVWSYTAGVEGTFQVVYEAKDACNVKTQCSFWVTFELNNPPVCNLNDTTIVICGENDVVLELYPTDPDLGVNPNEVVTCQLISGPGSIVGKEWFYHVTEDQPVSLTIRCTDACGLSCQKTITVDFEYGDVITGLCDFWQSETITMCGPGIFCLDIPQACNVVIGQGKVNGVNLCFEATEAGQYWADIECEDGCGNTCTSRAYFTVVFDPGLPDCGTTVSDARKDAGSGNVSSASGVACACPLRGDLNFDNEITAEDLSMLAAFFTEGRKPADASPECPALNVADVNCDGQLTIQDVQYLGAYLFASGPAPCTRCASAAASSREPRPITDLKLIKK